MNYEIIAEQIIKLKKADLKLRDRLIQEGKLGETYNEEMADLHVKNAEVLSALIDEIGYPTVDKVGKEASEAAWLVIQHSIGSPDFMRKGLRLLEIAVEEGKANPKNLAYLSDRIAVFEGKVQRYGTQFDWDENGEMSPNLYDDLVQVDERRLAIGLNSLEEQILIMRRRVKEEKEAPPIDYLKRKKEMNEWRKRVGWIR